MRSETGKKRLVDYDDIITHAPTNEIVDLILGRQGAGKAEGIDEIVATVRIVESVTPTTCCKYQLEPGEAIAVLSRSSKNQLLISASHLGVSARHRVDGRTLLRNSRAARG